MKKESEWEIIAAFQRTLKVRALSPEAKELADMFFFETLVRIHRAGEGEPYTGLKPAGTPLDPAVKEADMALEKGSIEEFIGKLSFAMAEEVRSRFKAALTKKTHAEESVEAGREFVEDYVQFVHYVEKLHSQIKAHEGHHKH